MSVGRVRRHPEELRRVAIERFKSCENVALLAREIGIPRQTLHRWIDESERVEADEDGQLVPATKGRESRLRKRMSHLKHVLANKTLEADFFRGALQRLKARRRGISARGEMASTTTSGANSRVTIRIGGGATGRKHHQARQIDTRVAARPKVILVSWTCD